MSLCVSCGLMLASAAALCPHHTWAAGDWDWSATNRIMCDFFHRHKVPPRAERDDDVWDRAAAAERA